MYVIQQCDKNREAKILQFIQNVRISVFIYLFDISNFLDGVDITCAGVRNMQWLIEVDPDRPILKN